MKQKITIYLHIINILLVTSFLTSCGGFELRGSMNIAPEFTPLHIQAEPNSSIAKALNNILLLNNIPATSDPKKAGFIIHLIEERQDNRVVAVNNYGKIISTELNYRIIFEGLNQDSKVIAPRQTIEAFREYVNPELEMLGKSEEAAMIREDLEQNLADRILRRLRPYLKTAPTAG